ncbi:multidrug ABC transporter [Ruminococcus sp.]|uniref:EamA family transporter n=1 Tax=Ruminococcus sp. TaxID=41978 RepID=UPI000EC7AEEC|nr:multidrug ABC transporter [Ruminococcus sp.]MCI6615922.1 multidrug ABC transporter [Ruminococcus sp.]HCI60070.1 multidrug ABC transporter [Ruminococcus sp.]
MNDGTLMIIFSLVFVVSVLISSISQVMLKTSANKSYSDRIKEYLNPTVIIAYGLFFLSTLITVFAYKVVPLSLGPVLESTGYIFVAVLGVVLLKEKMSRRKLFGMILILAGIALFSLGGMIF